MPWQYRLNIGLQVGNTAPRPEEIDARARVAHGFMSRCIGSSGCIDSYYQLALPAGPDDNPAEHVATEPTCVFTVGLTNTGRYDVADLYSDVRDLAIALGQDCIAVGTVDDDGEDKAVNSGVLIGPRASAWGEFNSEYFI